LIEGDSMNDQDKRLGSTIVTELALVCGGILIDAL